jgi:ribosomal protein S18 acetylase RimI-like enzyme
MTITTATTSVPTIGPTGHEEAIATLSAAFHRDPVFEWIYPDVAHRRTAVPHLFTVLVEQFATRHVSRTTPDVDGVALWLPPGEDLLPETSAESILAEVVEGAGPAADRLMACFELLDANHPHDPHWYLGFLGVRPELQGCGLGSALLLTTLTDVDDAGEPAYLEATSPTNRRLYERHGFEVVRALPLPDGPSLYAMWRQPQAGAPQRGSADGVA